MAGFSNKEKMTGNNPGTTMAEAAKETAATFGESAKSAAADVAHKAGETAAYVGKKADEASAAVGGGMKSLASTIRDKAPREGVLGSASCAVASTLERSGGYLQAHGLSGIGEDLTKMIRRNPIPALLIGIGLGFMVARATRS